MPPDHPVILHDVM